MSLHVDGVIAREKAEDGGEQQPQLPEPDFLQHLQLPLTTSDVNKATFHLHMHAAILPSLILENSSRPNMKVQITSWDTVATWRWDIPEDDNLNGQINLMNQELGRR
ncbi:anaphase-promoting complex subunit 11 [Verticillium dahliae VdLs.17]|uniref:Anaphase-promoting complex subunit 11 n=1 Tax=Verticillium dahliae (strain VdLs.17 / ATCC MYA-4575 / FGSC 10137) TaxID=498257 RepID=G2X8A6_VERDV|nr:anaphase-promoting complex subunit 11 [Verticillium dahliae VdLs.17]EGY15193.1 anaphase-promoting complex subunit 11 [Verticillium dahliae VdLs.17]